MSDAAFLRLRAQWIWIRPPRQEAAGLIPRGRPDFAEDRNRYVYFRKDFTIDGPVASAQFHASAGGRYQLFVNGILVGRGPARCHPQWQSVDTWDAASGLHPGANVIAALVHTYGVNTSWYELPRGAEAIYFDCGGFFLQGEVRLAGGGEVILDSDSSWLFLPASSWKQDTDFGGTGFMEQYDASREPQQWAAVGADVSGWKNALVQRIEMPFSGSDAVPFPRMVMSDLPSLPESPLLPQKIVLCAETDTERSAGPGDAWPLSRCRIARAQALLAGSPECVVETAPGAAALLVVDFGRVVIGRATLETEAVAGSVIELTYSETLNENGTVFQPPAVPGISTPPLHRILLRDGGQRFQQFETAGLRFLQLRASGCKSPLRIVSLRIEESRSASTASGAFSCSDQDLTALWNAAAYTAAVCRQDAMIDCPSREQRQWTGDAYIQSLLNYVTEEDTRLVRRFITQVAQTQRPDGMVAMATTSDLQAEARTFVPDFCLHWILSIERYLRYTGDEATTRELLPAVAKALAWFTAYVDSRGLLSEVPGWLFIDWSEALDRRGAVTVLNALFVAALRAAARLAGEAGLRPWAARWRALAATVSAAVNERLWSPDRGLYVDATYDGSPSAVASQHANSSVICFLVAPRGRWSRVLSAIMDPNRVRLTRSWRWDIERPFDATRDIVLAQPFFSHFLHAALDAAGRTDAIVRNIRSRWLPMLEEGSTFWESWQLTPTTSRCHAFSATPAYDLSTYVLGVQPIADGFARFRLRPWVNGLSWAEGKVPTPRGSIVVGWERRGEQGDVEVEVPDGLQGEVRLPSSCSAEGPVRLGPGRHTFSFRAETKGTTGGGDALR